MSVFTRRWERGYGGHAVIMSVPVSGSTPTPMHVGQYTFLLLKRASHSCRAGRPDRAFHAAAVADRLDVRTGAAGRDPGGRRPLPVRRPPAAPARRSLVEGADVRLLRPGPGQRRDRDPIGPRHL